MWYVLHGYHHDRPTDIQFLQRLVLYLTVGRQRLVLTRWELSNTKAVNGVLVGSVDGDSVIVRKAFPLFHAAGALGLTPMLEAALMLVRRI